MKRLITLLALLALFSCSKDDCDQEVAEIKERYEKLLENDMTSESRQQLNKEYAKALDEACE